MPNKLGNLARMTTATVGTGTLTLGAAVSGYLTFALAGVSDGDTVSYAINDGANSEIGTGIYTASGTTLSRTPSRSTNANALISLSGSAQVFITPRAEDFMRGVQGIQNANIVESHTSNAATFSLKTLNGNDPSVVDPVFCTFQDGSTLTITAALSVTIPSTGTLGTTSAIPFRLWFAIVNNAGTPLLAVRNCSDVNGTYDYPSNGLVTTLIITTPNTSGTAYTSTAVTGKAYSLLGYATYESGMATAGTWVTSPSAITIYVLGSPRAGQSTGKSRQFLNQTQVLNTTSGYVDSNLTGSITPDSAANLVFLSWFINAQIIQASTDLNVAFVSLRRGGSVIAVPNKFPAYGTQQGDESNGNALDAPSSAGSVTYVVSGKLTIISGSPTLSLGSSDGGGILNMTEIMG